MGEGGWKGSDAGAGRQAMPGEGQAGRQQKVAAENDPPSPGTGMFKFIHP